MCKSGIANDSLCETNMSIYQWPPPLFSALCWNDTAWRCGFYQTGRVLTVINRRAFPQWIAPCGLRGCKNRARSVSWPEVVKGLPNQCVHVDCFVSVSYMAVFSVSLLFADVCSVLCFWLPVPVQLIAWKVERLVSEITYYVSSGTLNPTHSLTPTVDLVHTSTSPEARSTDICRQ